MRQNQIVIILCKQVFKQAVRGAEKKSEIAAYSNKYKDTFNNLNNCSNTKISDHPDSLNRLKFIDKESYNELKFRDGLLTFLKEDCLNKYISITSLEFALEILDS